jgi:uncharacterized membrane protein YczE
MRQFVKPVFLKRLVVYCLGLFIMALGVSFSVKSNLGVSPVNSIPKVLSEIFTQLSMGSWTTIIFCCFILVQLLVLGRKFHPSRFLQILCSFLFGRFVDMSNWLTALFLPDPQSYVIRLAYLVISMALVGLGILFYLEPKILPLPGEGVMLAVSEKYGFPLHRCKIGFDAAVVLVAAVTSLIFFHYFNGVREGTVLAAFGVGKFLGIFTKLFKAQLGSFLDKTKESEPEVKALPVTNH